MSELKEKVNQENYCPCCNHFDLEYSDSGMIDKNYYYDWKCPNCGAEGREWFDIIFSAHEIIKEGE